MDGQSDPKVAASRRKSNDRLQLAVDDYLRRRPSQNRGGFATRSDWDMMNDLLDKCERAAKARLRTELEHPARLSEYQKRLAQIETEDGNAEIKNVSDLDAHLKRRRDVLDNLEIPYALNAIAMLNFLSEVRAAVATRDVTTAVRAAIMVGGLAERLGVETEVAGGQKFAKIRAKRDAGKKQKTNDKHERWIREARIILALDPTLGVGAVADMINKKEKQMGLRNRKGQRGSKSLGSRAIQNVIRRIFSK